MTIPDQQNRPRFHKRLLGSRAVKRLWKVLVALAVFAILIAVFHNRILLAVGNFMAVRDPLEKSDLILVMNHEAQTIPFAAADLYRKGYAPKLVLGGFRSNRIEQSKIVSRQHRFGERLLASEGVPPENIEVVGNEVKDTLELGLALSDYCKTKNISSIIVVTTSPFSRLDRNDLLRNLDGKTIKLRMYPVRSMYFDETDWWHLRQGWIQYFDAYYLSFLHFTVR